MIFVCSVSDPEALQQSQSLGKADEEPFSFLLPKETLGTLPIFARDQFGCQGNVGRDGWPLDNSSSAPLSPCIYTERRHLADTVRKHRLTIQICRNIIKQ